MSARIQPIVALAGSIAALALLPLYANASAFHIEPGHGAMWIDPSRNGEGWILEILSHDTAALYWIGLPVERWIFRQMESTFCWEPAKYVPSTSACLHLHAPRCFT